MDLFSIERKNVLGTGGSRGIGEVVAAGGRARGAVAAS
jgi:NAD(P)-dependent dehydrogenase (short-subunit alcohol dehydrogenase family)